MGAFGAIGARLAARQEIAVVAMLILTLAMMVMPMPPVLADVLIAINIAVSVLLMMAAIQISAPIQLSTLPSLILLTTTFRLSLSITTSRMVLVQGDAGEIIRAFGEFVIAGNVVVGLVVYLIITIVQFLVIAKGSERVAEVAARFTLDALPGKQMAIDSDLRNGDIDKHEARRRRTLLSTENHLLGSMDGAMKFVKGDSVASLVIIVINLVGGIVIGSVQRGLPFAEAVRTYSLLAVGDGLIAQIPALLISLTAGLVVTRSTSEAGRNLGQDIVGQIVAQPRALQIGAAVMAALGFVPGFPTAVFLTLAVVVGAAGWALSRRATRDAARLLSESKANERSATEPARLTLSLAGGDDPQVAARVEAVRLGVAEWLGLAVPRVAVAPAPAAGPGWRFDIDGVPAEQGDAAELDEGLAVVRRALTRSAGRFMGIQEAQRIMTAVEQDYPDLVKETLKVAPIGRISEVLRRLLDEAVPITDVRTILETCGEWAPREVNTAILTEHVRLRLRSGICFAASGPGKVIPMLLMEPALEAELQQSIVVSMTLAKLVLNDATTGRMLSVLDHYAAQLDAANGSLTLLASHEIRRHLSAALKRAGSSVPVLSFDEVAHDYQVEVVGTMQKAWLFPDDQAAARPKPQLVAASA